MLRLMSFIASLMVAIVLDAMPAQRRRNRPEPCGRRRAGRSFEHRVEGRTGSGRRGAQALADRLGHQASLAHGERARHRGRPGPLARLVPERVPGTRCVTARRQGTRRVPHPDRQRDDAAPVVSIVGNDARGVLFGVGRLLRELRVAPGRVILPEGLNLASAPKYPLRGHQLGYRPKTNSYDAWDLAQWDRYIRDLAIFGTNAIELIPPRSDDAANSPHFPLPPMEMMAGMSQICADYGLDVWIWYPAMDADYADPKTVEHALAEWARGVQELAPDRCRLRAGGRPRAHASQGADGPPGKTGGEPAPLSSQGPDVGLAAEFLARVVRRIPQAHAEPSPPGWPASSSARRCA